MESEIKAIIAQLLEIPVAEISASTSMETVDTWDSLRHMEIVVAIEQRFGVEFEAEEALEMTSLEGIMRILATKTVRS